MNVKLEFRFIPKNLILAKEEIIERHTGISEIVPTFTDYSLMNMIRRLTSLSRQEAENEALVLTKKELEIIARYLPHNYYKLQMENLFLIIRLRCNINLNRILLNEWQNAYDNKEFNAFLRTFMLENKDSEKLEEIKNVSVQKFISFLTAENIPVEYGKMALSLKNIKSEKLQDRLEYLGIKQTSRLFEDCRFLFYIFCGEKDYLEAGEKEILFVVKKYDENLKKKFLRNFLQQTSLENLKKFNRIEEYFFAFTGENHTDKFNAYFYGFDVVLVRKYVDWIHIYIINKIFGNDERSLFWERYHHETVEKYAYNNSVVMEFNNYIAIEFLGQASGPLYIYKKEYFEHYVRKIFKTYGYEATELKSYLYNNTDYVKNAKLLSNINGTRLVHLPNPGWQSKFDSVVIRNRITERIL